MVEDWDDLFKVLVRRLLYPRPLHLLDSPFQRRRVRYNATGWRRLGVSAGIALFLLVADVALLILQLPDNRQQDVEPMRKIAWHNNGSLVDVAEDNVIIGSFSRIVKLNSSNDENQFVRLPSVSIERTDFRDFSGGSLPDYDGLLLNCTKKEGWRMLCRVRCENRFYQYKLRLDVTTDTNPAFYFVSTDAFDFSSERVNDYVRQLQRQLDITVKNVDIDYDNGNENNNNADGFLLYTDSDALPPERVTRPRFNHNATLTRQTAEILTHDAIATIILGSIVVSGANITTPYHVRRPGIRPAIEKEVVSGTVAISQAPYVTLLGTLIMYIVLQLLSVVLQSRLGLNLSAPEISVLLESVGVSCTTNWSNVRCKTLRAHYSYDVDEEGERVGHIGYMPAPFLRLVRQFVKYGAAVQEDGQLDEDDKDEGASIGETDTVTDIESQTTTTMTKTSAQEQDAEKGRKTTQLQEQEQRQRTRNEERGAQQRERLEREYNVVDRDTFFELTRFGQVGGEVTRVEPRRNVGQQQELRRRRRKHNDSDDGGGGGEA